MEQIICSNLAVGYDGSVVQRDITFSVHSGDYLCIIGKNGAGKSTLMKTILGLLSPISGSITMSGGLKSTDIGYLPQQTQIQKDFPASVIEVVLSGCLNKHGMRCFYNKAEKQLADSMLAKIGISDIKKKSYSKLSGGQQQRVLLARALCATNKILLLDEPVAGLDPQSTEELYSLIKQLNDEGITIIMITHDVKTSAPYTSHLLVMDEAASFMKSCEYTKSSGGDNIG